jgi:Mn2+/Fe2+ NRAMP family transporter
MWRPRRLLRALGPGLLVAATGVGAGDLATASLAGHRLGVTIVWAVVIGAVLKYVMTEALARWQLQTGCSLIEGTGAVIGRWPLLIFLIYLVPWCYVVGAALISAVGSATQALLPLPFEGALPRVLWGGALSGLAVLLAWRGGYRVFERVMAVCIGIMTVAVVATAIMVEVDWPAAARGLVIPAVPDVDGAVGWTLALIGGVGGTVTLLCYGYWIRQRGRVGISELPLCRIDLAMGYLMTAVFGVAMVCIASVLDPIDGSKGAALITALADQLRVGLGGWGGVLFLVGAWAALFSSMLGVWQSVPIIVVDTIRSVQRLEPLDADHIERTPMARCFMLGLAIVPLLHVAAPFDQVQKLYAMTGAMFLPLLAIVLLVLTLQRGRMGLQRTGPLGVVGLIAVFGLFGWLAIG